MHHPRALCLLFAFALAGCASTAADVEPANTPLAPYRAMSCQQLKQEYKRVAVEILKVSRKIDEHAVSDRIAMGVGVVFFWPALFLIDSEGADHEALAQLKGERYTLDESMEIRHCDAAPANNWRSQTTQQQKIFHHSASNSHR